MLDLGPLGPLIVTLPIACAWRRVMSGSTPASSTNRGVHCISVCTALTFRTSPMQAAEGRQGWIGSSEIRSPAARSTNVCYEVVKYSHLEYFVNV